MTIQIVAPDSKGDEYQNMHIVGYGNDFAIWFQHWFVYRSQHRSERDLDMSNRLDVRRQPYA